jgi:uncharacterized paraquat-inducible protein A
MTTMSCPSCGLTVTYKRGEDAEAEHCPRCLARSSGAMSIRLRPGAAPKPLGIQARVRELLKQNG